MSLLIPQRKFNENGGLLARFALSLALASPTAFAQLEESQPDSATITVGANCTLINAIQNANANTDAANPNTDEGACTAGAGDDTIVLPTNSTQTLSVLFDNSSVGVNDILAGLPAITSAITINGNGSTIERSSVANTPNFRLFSVLTNGKLTLNQVTLKGGNPGADQIGGAIDLRGISDQGDKPTLTLNASTVTGNSAGGGGGIGNVANGSTITINNSTISGNTAPGTGQAQSGGAVYVASFAPTTLTFNNSTVTGNTALYGGGVALGVAVEETVLSFNNTIVAGNTGTIGGGDPPEHEISGIVNTFNTRASLFGHAGRTYAQSFFVISDGEPVDLGPGIGSTNVLATSTLLNGMTNPASAALSAILNRTLAANGGPTRTHALASNSPAIAAATDQCQETDQRGVARPVENCSIGAYELQTLNNASTGNQTVSFDSANTIEDLAASSPVAEGFTPPAGRSFSNAGLYSFKITGLNAAANPGQTATVVITLPSDTNPTAYAKCDPITKRCSDFAGAVINGNVVTLTLQDGGAGDSDNTINGTIADPGAPVVGGAGTAGGGGSGGALNWLMLLPMLGLVALRRRKI